MRPRRTLLLVALSSALLAGASLLPLGPFQVFELKTLDLRFRMREAWRQEHQPRMVRAVLLDDASMAAVAHWPLPYETYASALERLREAGAGVIGIDLLLAPADTTRPRERANYRSLVHQVRRTPHLVLGVAPPSAQPVRGIEVRLPDAASSYPWACAALDGAAPGAPVTDPVPAVRRLSTREAPAVELAQAAHRVGQVQLHRDDDGVVRRLPLVSHVGEACYPSFALQVLCEKDGIPPSGVRHAAGAIELWRDGKRLRRIPVDGAGCLLVNYRRHGFEPDLSLVSVAYPDGADLGSVRGRVVLLGSTARTLGRYHSTPLAPQVADVHVFAAAIETVLSGRFVVPAARWAQFFVTWAFLFLAALLMVRLPPWRGVLVGLGLMLCYVVFEKAMFVLGGRWFDFIGPMAAMQFAVIGYPLWSYRGRSQALLDELGGLRDFDDLILSTMTSGVLVADENGRVVKANARAAQLLGAGEDAALAGRPLAEVFGSCPAALQAVERALIDEPLEPHAAGIRPPVHVPVVCESRDPDGDRLFDLSVSVLDTSHRRSPGMGRHTLLTFTDMTEHVRLLQEDERRARLAAIGEIAAKLGHEIRNSLGGLRLYVENVREEIDPQSTAGQSIDNMVEEIESLYRKIDELREYARDPLLEKVDCDLKQILEEALAFAGQRLRDKRVQVVIEAPPKLGPVWVDRRQMRDAFQNLINNAAEAAPDNGMLRIRIEHTNGSNGAAAGTTLVHFEDDGPGIPPEVGDQVFSLFFTTKADAGTGLGLAIVKKIVENHGGRVSWTSRPGCTVFTVALPPERRVESPA